jgi:hypothetical protein
MSEQHGPDDRRESGLDRTAANVPVSANTQIEESKESM